MLYSLLAILLCRKETDNDLRFGAISYQKLQAKIVFVKVSFYIKIILTMEKAGFELLLVEMSDNF